VALRDGVSGEFESIEHQVRSQSNKSLLGPFFVVNVKFCILLTATLSCHIRGGAEAAVDGADRLVLRLILHACDRELGRGV